MPAGKSGTSSLYDPSRMAYFLGMMLRAREYAMGKTATVPFTVPVGSFGYCDAMGLGCDFERPKHPRVADAAAQMALFRLSVSTRLMQLALGAALGNRGS